MKQEVLKPIEQYWALSQLIGCEAEQDVILTSDALAPIFMKYYLLSEHEEERMLVVQNCELSPEMLLLLQSEQDEGVLSHVVARADCPESLLEKIIHPGYLFAYDTDFLFEVAQHPNANGIVLERLANGVSWEVALEVVAHPNCPESTLEDLMNKHRTNEEMQDAIRNSCACTPRIAALLMD